MKEKQNEVEENQRKIRISLSIDPKIHRKSKEILDKQMIRVSSYIERKLREVIEENERKNQDKEKS